MQARPIVYGHSFCPQVHTIRAILDQIGVPYTYIDIRKDDQSRLRVREINAGDESVPTLVFADGSTLTEPSDDALYAHLHALGFQLKPPSKSERFLIYLGHPIISAFGLGVMIGAGFCRSLLMVGLGILLILTPVAARNFRR
jgi:mycoredoxin